MKMAFKKHMVRYFDEGSFTTMCSINESCSEAFKDDVDNIVGYGEKEETTCKKCLRAWDKEVEKFNKQQAFLRAFSLYTDHELVNDDIF